jgi:hypothetical protein
LFRHEKSWDDTNELVSSVPKSSIISKSQSFISSDIPDIASLLSFSKVLLDNVSKSWDALKYITRFPLSISSLATQHDRKDFPVPTVP